MKKTIVLCAAALAVCAALACPALAAEETDEATDEAGLASAFDESALFGDESAGIETVEQGDKGTAVTTFLKTEAVRIGGSYTGTLSPSWTWNDPWNRKFDPADPDGTLLSPSVGAKVFFEARPDEETRFYGSVRTDWPFADEAATAAGGTVEVPNLSVFELFADRSWGDRLFFRFGKHTVKWGVGYFWSPADVINLTAIDVTDPTAQLEGPISLRLQVPFAGTQNNLWAYAILPETDGSDSLDPEDIAVAGKYEFLLGNWEIGTGAFWQKDRAPKAMLTATGSVWKCNLFGEAVLGWGSDKDWIEIGDQTPYVTLSKDGDGIYFSATAGFSYIDTKNDLTGYFQYFLNGDGYSDSRRKGLIADGRDLLADQAGTSGAEALSAAFKGLIWQSGRHYAGVYLGKSGLVNEKLSLSFLAIANLSDLSGFLQPSASWEFFDGFSASFSPSFYWATDALWGAGSDGEYVILADGPAMTLSFKATLGSGKF
jgi:hypothetical protein